MKAGAFYAMNPKADAYHWTELQYTSEERLKREPELRVQRSFIVLIGNRQTEIREPYAPVHHIRGEAW